LFNLLRPHASEKPNRYIESLRKQFGSELIQKIFFPEVREEIREEEEVLEEYEPEVVKKVKSNPRKK